MYTVKCLNYKINIKIAFNTVEHIFTISILLKVIVKIILFYYFS